MNQSIESTNQINQSITPTNQQRANLPGVATNAMVSVRLLSSDHSTRMFFAPFAKVQSSGANASNSRPIKNYQKTDMAWPYTHVTPPT